MLLLFFTSGAMDTFLEHRLGLIDLKLGLEILELRGDAAAVGAATGIDEVELFIDDFTTSRAPIGLAATVFLCLLGIGIGVTMLPEELGDMCLRVATTHGTTLKGVVLVIELVGASHFERLFRDESLRIGSGGRKLMYVELQGLVMSRTVGTFKVVGWSSGWQERVE